MGCGQQVFTLVPFVMKSIRCRGAAPPAGRLRINMFNKFVHFSTKPVWTLIQLVPCSGSGPGQQLTCMQNRTTADLNPPPIRSTSRTGASTSDSEFYGTGSVELADPVLLVLLEPGSLTRVQSLGLWKN